MSARSIETSPQFYARMAGAFYVITIVTGALAAFATSGRVITNLIATAAYIAVTLLNPLVFFGFYCLLIGYLVFKSTFLPRILRVLMAFGGISWLTFLSPSLAGRLSPYNMAPGVLGEGALTVWLLVKGVNIEKWKARSLDARSRS